ncbi:MAG TPA: FAD binding domain-containing protein [Bacteroidales bacterium]|jgi:carbon-monoxide dehydrogenase medium subunit|nr:FAD binding domain-containing protein [Bacteroidales bacterium]|tara:strand:- start:1669 stop:2532 length:864 start_codon:yes stop_codon:yes gene_type:complete
MEFDVISPKSTPELLSVIADNQANNFRISAGFTDLIHQIKSIQTKDLILINLAQLDEPNFKQIVENENNIQIGALVTATEIVDDKIIEENFPVLHQAASKLASTQIRNVATVGGNICNVSPSGDMTAALIALKATCIILDCDGSEREEQLSSFIRGLKKTSLTKKEVIKNITIPKNSTHNIKSGFEKIGSRKSMEISIVSLAYHFQMNKDGNVIDAGVACGAVAPTIPFTTSACELLIGKNIYSISDTVKEEFACKVLEYATPISDIRASDWYRKEVLFNISKTIFE